VKDDLDRLIVNLGRASGSAIVGVIDDEENASHLFWAEFGTTRGEPPRPTLTVTTDRLAPAIFRAERAALVRILDGKDHHTTGQEILADVGRDLAEEVQQAIDNDPAPPLAASTLAARRRAGQGDRALVATGEMMRAVRAKTDSKVDGLDEEADE
jgi:hypothetical protein